MSSLLFLKPEPISSLVGGTYAGLNNLLTPDPKEVASNNNGGGGFSIDIDLGVAVNVDTIYLGFTSATVTLVNAVQTGTGMGTGLVSRAMLVGGTAMPAAVGKRLHVLTRLTATYSSRYWRISISQSGNSTIGVLALGAAIQPAFGHEWGSGRVPDDRSAVTALRGGGYGIERGARVPVWKFTVGDLTDAETTSLWLMADDVGNSSPIMVCEDPDYTAGLQERIHWGLLDRPEAYERDSPGRNRWSFTLREWN